MVTMLPEGECKAGDCYVTGRLNRPGKPGAGEVLGLFPAGRSLVERPDGAALGQRAQERFGLMSAATGAVHDPRNGTQCLLHARHLLQHFIPSSPAAIIPPYELYT